MDWDDPRVFPSGNQTMHPMPAQLSQFVFTDFIFFSGYLDINLKLTGKPVENYRHSVLQRHSPNTFIQHRYKDTFVRLYFGKLGSDQSIRSNIINLQRNYENKTIFTI